MMLKSKRIALVALCAVGLPLAAQSESAKPEVVKSDVVQPETVKSETVKSDAVQPNLVLPNTVQPNLVVPNSAQPDAVQPGSAKITPPQISSGWSFQSTQGYSITPAAGWTTNPIGTLGAIVLEVVFTAPKENNFAANLNVVIVKASPSDTLEIIATANSAGMPQFFNGYRKISQKFVSVGGLRAWDAVANHSSVTPPQKLWMRQLVVLQKGQAYIFTCTALDANHRKYEKSFSEMMQSVRWAK